MCVLVRTILWHALAVVVHTANIVLRGYVALVGGFSVPKSKQH